MRTEMGIAGLMILLASAGVSFVLGRWLSRRRREKTAQRERAVAEAGRSRQVRRAQDRRKQR